MFYNSVKKKVIIFIIFTFFSFLLINSLLQIEILPTVIKVNERDRINDIWDEIVTDSKDLKTEDEFIKYLTNNAYENNIYISIYKGKSNELVWSYLDETVVKELQDKTANLYTDTFIVDTKDGEYEVVIMENENDLSMFKQYFTEIWLFSFLIGVMFLLILISGINYYVLNPMCLIESKISLLIKDNNVKVKRTTREDEIGNIENGISELYERFIEIKRELDGDEELQKEKERLSRENLAIVSHELKTPLTVLKSQTECMLMNIGDYKNRDKYLEKNLIKINDMEKLVYSILESIKLDQQKIEIEKEQVCISELIRTQVLELDILLKEKELNVNYEMKELYKEINVEMFSKVSKNIIENAIKYSEQGKDINIILDEDMLEIININNEVSSKDLKDVFKPFVRVESSRNSDNGGSGIGLYIVSTILEKHKFSYSLRKVRNKVIFTINF